MNNTDKFGRILGGVITAVFTSCILALLVAVTVKVILWAFN